MRYAPGATILTILALSVPVFGGDPVKEYAATCTFAPRLYCPNVKLSLPGAGITALCERLAEEGVVSAEKCPDFVAQHTCPELLDAQVRGTGHYGGDCYGVLLTNCCDEPIVVDLSVNPIPRGDGEPKALVIWANDHRKDVDIVHPNRRSFRIVAGEDLIAMWLDAKEMFNIPGAKLTWEAHAITAASGSTNPK